MICKLNAGQTRGIPVGVSNNNRNPNLRQATCVVHVVTHVNDTLCTIPVRRDVIREEGAFIADTMVARKTKLLRAGGHNLVALG
jgi:hypothetical protein